MLSIMKIMFNSNNIEKSFVVKLLQSFLLMATLSSVYADDTEIFYSESAVNSNVLFIMDNSGSMKEGVPGTTAGDQEISFSYKIAASKDDAEQKQNRSVSRYSSDLEMVKDGTTTWRNFTNEQSYGKISDQWGVRGWPTIYVLDHNGVIRHKSLRGKPLEAAIMALVAEAEAGPGTK